MELLSFPFVPFLVILFFLFAVVFYVFLAATKRRRSQAAAAALLTPAFVNSLLARGARANGHAEPARVSAVKVVTLAHCGDGKASTTDRLALELTFLDNPGGRVPARVLLKGTLLPTWLRLGASFRLMRLAGISARALAPLGADRLVYFFINMHNFYFPHAPDVMYANETRFYGELRPELPADVEAPQVYGFQCDLAAKRFFVLMEDLAQRHAVFPTALEASPVSHVRLMMRMLASLHGRFWESPRFEGDLAWVPTIRQGGMRDVFHELGHGLIADHVRSHPFEQHLLAPLGLSVDQLWAGLERAELALAAAPTTLCHGDCHVQNTYCVRSQGQIAAVGLFDWQLTLRCSWARDVAYIIGTALAPEDRRAHERELLNEYLAELRRCLPQAAAAPSAEDAWTLYIKSMAWGLVIGWLICPPNNYGEALTAANIGRLVTACKDLGTFIALGVKHPPSLDELLMN